VTAGTGNSGEHVSISPSLGGPFRSFSILAFLLATGCAPSHWEKPGGDVADQENDLLACRQSAQLSLGSDPALTSRVRPTMGSGVLAIQAAPPMDSERQLREFQATQDCMHDKGYQLKPAQAR